MALDFDGSNDALTLAAAPVSAYPFSMACLGNPDLVSSTDCLMALNSSIGTAGSDEWGLLSAGAVAGDPVQFFASTGTRDLATTSTGMTVDTWFAALGVGTLATDRTVYINGGSAGTNTVDDGTPAVDRTRIADSYGSGDFFNGRAAWAALWSAALGADEAVALGKFYDPRLIRPASLEVFWPIFGRQSPEIPYFGEHAMTLEDAPTYFDHPRVFMAF